MIERILLKLAEWALLGLIYMFTAIWLLGIVGLSAVCWAWDKVRPSPTQE